MKRTEIPADARADLSGVGGGAGAGNVLAGQGIFDYWAFVGAPVSQAGFDFGRDLWRLVHPVRAQRGGPDFQGGALGHLRRLLDLVHVRDAYRRCRFHSDGTRQVRAPPSACLGPCASVF